MEEWCDGSIKFFIECECIFVCVFNSKLSEYMSDYSAPISIPSSYFVSGNVYVFKGHLCNFLNTLW